jgi:hypothetical protein
MSARSRKSVLTPRRPRTINLYARFTPDGPEASDRLAFIEFFTAATDRVQELKKKELSRREAEMVQRKARLAKLECANRKVMPILAKAMNNRIPVGVAARRIKSLVPDTTLLKELFEVLSRAVVATPEQVAKQTRTIARREAKLARDEADLDRSSRLLKWRGAIHDGLSRLAKAATAGDLDAAKGLAGAATDATGLLFAVERLHPELLRPMARGQMYWPVLASEEAGWEKGAMQRVADLELGADLQWFKVRFRKARGADANLPARLWAKAAVRAIEETRFRFLCFGRLLREFGSIEALSDYCSESGWNMGKEPEWVKGVAQLKEFSSESLTEWKPVIREMIREQLPEFHTRPEWSNQRNTAEASGRNTPGEIRNAILDDITSALQRLVPTSQMPKSAC